MVKVSNAVGFLEKNPLRYYSMYIADRLWVIVVGCMMMFFLRPKRIWYTVWESKGIARKLEDEWVVCDEGNQRVVLDTIDSIATIHLPSQVLLVASW